VGRPAQSHRETVRSLVPLIWYNLLSTGGAKPEFGRVPGTLWGVSFDPPEREEDV
jgi:hypothetical protein